MFNQHSLCISIFLLLYSIKHLDGCTIPAILQSANWNYDFDNRRETLTFTSSGMTGLQYRARGENLNTYNCIANITDEVYVFKSSDSYSHRGENRWIYLCMKMTKVTENLHYFYLLADIYTSVTPNDRVYSPLADTVLSDNSPPCDTFCSCTPPIPDKDARPLQREGTNETLPGSKTLCGTCASPCASPGYDTTTTNATDSPGYDSTTSNATDSPGYDTTTSNATDSPGYDTTTSNATDSPGYDTTTSNATDSPGYDTTTSNAIDSPGYDITTSNAIDDGCTIPANLQNGTWNYDFDNRRATLTFTSSVMTGVKYRAIGEDLNTYNCIANTDEVYVFKSSDSYSHKGKSRWIYLCVKMTKVTKDLYYFYLLADISTSVTPNDRVLSPPAGTMLSDNSPTCATFCSYTTPIPDNDARPLQREGTTETLPDGETLCGTCASPCAYTDDGTTETSPVVEILCGMCALHCGNTNNGTTETLQGVGIYCCTCALLCADTNNGTDKTLPDGETLCDTCASSRVNSDDGTTETLPGGEIFCRTCALQCANTNNGTTETLPGGEILCRIFALLCTNTNNGTTETLPDGERLGRTYFLLCPNPYNGLSYVGISGMCYVLVLLAKLVI